MSAETWSTYEARQVKEAWRHRRLLGAAWHAGAWLRYEVDAALYRLRRELGMVSGDQEGTG